ncbi:MAG: DUF4867 family protein [Chloroflexota bacterium]
MKRTLALLSLITIIALTACGGGEEGLGAGGGQSLREGSTALYHSPIAQDETYQTILGLNILLYPAPVDEESFTTYGAPHWELDPSEFTQTMLDAFNGEMSEESNYEPVVESLQDDPFIAQIQEAVYDGEPVQVGWVYGNTGDLEIMYHTTVSATLIPARDVMLFAGADSDLDAASGAIDSKDTTPYFTPSNSVIEMGPGSLFSVPIRAIKESGQLTAVIIPEGAELEPITLTGSSINIEAADTSARFE